jgi:hypothetical protein
MADAYLHVARALRGASYAQRLAAVACAALAAAAVARAAHRNLPAGAPRLAVIVPLLALFTALPVRAAPVAPPRLRCCHDTHRALTLAPLPLPLARTVSVRP